MKKYYEHINAYELYKILRTRFTSAQCERIIEGANELYPYPRKSAYYRIDVIKLPDQNLYNLAWN